MTQATTHLGCTTTLFEIVVENAVVIEQLVFLDSNWVSNSRSSSLLPGLEERIRNDSAFELSANSWRRGRHFLSRCRSCRAEKLSQRRPGQV